MGAAKTTYICQADIRAACLVPRACCACLCLLAVLVTQPSSAFPYDRASATAALQLVETDDANDKQQALRSKKKSSSFPFQLPDGPFSFDGKRMQTTSKQGSERLHAGKDSKTRMHETIGSAGGIYKQLGMWLCTGCCWGRGAASRYNLLV